MGTPAHRDCIKVDGTKNGDKNGVQLPEQIKLSSDESFTIQFVASEPSKGTILSSGASSSGYFLYFDPATTLIRLRFNVKENVEVRPGTAMDAGLAHIAIVYNADSHAFMIYKDNVALNDEPIVLNGFATANMTTICGGYKVEYCYQGDLQYFSYTNQALSQAEIFN